HAANPPIEVVVAGGGPVRGMITEDGRAFLGIPYAAPPVGNLRWQPPQPPADWPGVLDASEFGSSCPQNPGPFGLASTNEDCLYLNVYTPPVSTPVGQQSLPVMVWLHPGAFQVGDSARETPTDILARGVVVVTLNYRLGVLGWLAHPGLTAESPDATSGNYGLQDQQKALRWVQTNIAAFGGNPNNVTIFGESAGGVSVHAHMISPQSEGLFHRAIIQSGAYAMTFPTLASAETQGTAFATQVGCANLACLRALPVSTILQNQNPLPSAFVPRKDGELLPLSPSEAFATGAFHHVPVIEGSTHDEFSLFVATTFFFRNPPLPANLTYEQRIAILLGVPGAVAPFIAAQYPLASYSSQFEALTAIGTDSAFACNSLLAMSLLAPQVSTWGYEFDDPNAPMGALPQVPGFSYGAFHGSELQYLFDVRRTQTAPALDAAQQQLANAMQSYWTKFAASGNPNSSDAPAWPQHVTLTQATVATSRIQLLAPPTPVPYYTAQFAADHKCSFWAQLAGGS
ncbi:MAG TPA: carboxylesterase family protein, partial [Polyangiales bacterium]|nr:carboxylesterase family protein [Polyangiales bacterium]